MANAFAPYQSSPDDRFDLSSSYGVQSGPTGVFTSTEPPPSGHTRVNAYETSLGLRLDIEAAIAYILGPFTGILLLILERQNDYVRFHAWQSALVFTIMIFIHFVFMFISDFISRIMFVVDGLLALFLAYKAFTLADTLQRYRLPWIGDTASEWVDIE